MIPRSKHRSYIPKTKICIYANVEKSVVKLDTYLLRVSTSTRFNRFQEESSGSGSDKRKRY